MKKSLVASILLITIIFNVSPAFAKDHESRGNSHNQQSQSSTPSPSTPQPTTTPSSSTTSSNSTQNNQFSKSTPSNPTPTPAPTSNNSRRSTSASTPSPTATPTTFAGHTRRNDSPPSNNQNSSSVNNIGDEDNRAFQNQIPKVKDIVNHAASTPIPTAVPKIATPITIPSISEIAANPEKAIQTANSVLKAPEGLIENLTQNNFYTNRKLPPQESAFLLGLASLFTGTGALALKPVALIEFMDKAKNAARLLGFGFRTPSLKI